MDEWLCSSAHNKDDVEALDKCAPLARFILFVPKDIYRKRVNISKKLYGHGDARLEHYSQGSQ